MIMILFHICHTVKSTGVVQGVEKEMILPIILQLRFGIALKCLIPIVLALVSLVKLFKVEIIIKLFRLVYQFILFKI